jgi:Na+-translocating ferredoxin:NAD+ oxidoreductase RnfD subunit
MSTEVNGLPAVKPQPVAAPKKGGRFGKFKPFLAPILITCILAAGNLEYGMLEGHWGTAAAIVAAILSEIAFSLFVSGRWPHIASAYITGISVGILVRTPLLWPYIMCSLLSISSKYALRLKGRHLFNPSNLGVSVLLFLVPTAVAPLSQQWGNDTPVLLIIGTLGCLILYSLGRLHITLTYIAAFVVLSFVRSGLTGRVWASEIALLTAPAYQLFMFFMITDPKTTTRTRPRQCAVAVLVATVETLLRLAEEIHAPYYALFITAPATNLLELWWDARHAPEKGRPAPASGVAATGLPAASSAAAPAVGNTSSQ